MKLKCVQENDVRLYLEKLYSIKNIVLFGAGGKGKLAFEFLKLKGIEVLCFCDSNPKLQNKRYCGVDVFSYEEIKKRYYNYNVFLTVTPDKAILISEKLKKNGEKNKIYHFCIPFKTEKKLIDMSCFSKNKDSYEKIYDELQDDISKKIFNECLKYRITGDGISLLNEINGSSFFDKDMIVSKSNHIYLDIGAYTGDTLMKFCEFSSGEYKKIIAFEPEKTNFKKLKKFVEYARLKNCELYNVGAWNIKKTLSIKTVNIDGFENANLFSSAENIVGDSRYNYIQRKIIDYAIEEKIAVNSIDNILEGEKATIIKINAMAADLQIIEGAKETISKYKPVIITEYGSQSEAMIKIPLLLKEIRNDYKLFMRQKMIFGDSKTILYAL